MLSKFKNLKNRVIHLKRDAFDLKIESYRKQVDEINQIHYESLEDQELELISMALREQVKSGTPINSLLAKSFALVRETSKRVLGLEPFDEQLMAGIAMHEGNLVEMQTGEGKTLAAVFPAYLNALEGKGVHILTFNDYLACRDAAWMGPVFKFLGLTVGYIEEKMGAAERKVAYGADITYLTAKEAGFDYLREFLCYEKESIVQRFFHFAIIDEADSILIDEARIPLVIAGSTDDERNDLALISKIVGNLTPEVDYKTDEYFRNVFLTSEGEKKAECALNCNNLYDIDSIALLTRMNWALYANVLLKKDRDYIVRNEKIELIDEFTGRVAEKRHWPDGLQVAVELKEGIEPKIRGKIMGSITLQHFIKRYPKLCGMTGTAKSAADEFRDFYGFNVVAIPTHKPCARVDHSDLIFTHTEAKQNALIREIAHMYAIRRPVLVGTASVGESENLVEALKKVGVKCQVLNAKNDTLEAKIISQAGLPGAVTVSTNMAGRGTDIKLGGEHEQYRDEVVALGGLYVIGTNRYESRRIDNQLIGRAGRQGDPGESRFFVSLEDSLLKKYRIEELIPQKLYPKRQEGSLDNPIIRREVARAQRIIEGQNFEIRKNLYRYTYITEGQRQIIHQKRYQILMGDMKPNLVTFYDSNFYKALCQRVDKEVIQKIERQIALYQINQCWIDFLDYISYEKESIHLFNIAGKNPLDVFNRNMIDAFDSLLERIDHEIIDTFKKVEIGENGIDLDKEGIKGPSATWTYLVDDGAEQIGILPITLNPVAASMSFPMLLLSLGIYNRFFRKKREL